MAKLKGMGTSIKYAPAHDSAENLVKTIGSLTSIGEIAPTSDEVDATTLDSADGDREFLQGLKDSGELPLTGYHDAANTGQSTMRTLYASGASGYFWVTFPDQTTVAFNAYVKGYSDGSADVDGVVGFGCTLRISGLVQVISTAYSNVAGELEATATVLTDDTPTYQWYSNDTADYDSPSIIDEATSATYTTGAPGYYFCTIKVPGYRPVNSQIFEVV